VNVGKVRLDIAGIRLMDAEIAYVDEGSGQRLEVKNLDI